MSEKIKSYKVTEDILTDKYINKYTDIGLQEVRGFQPFGDDLSYDKACKCMTEYLASDVDESTGMEYIYNHNTESLNFNILGDENMDFSEFTDTNPVNQVGVSNSFENISLDSYVSGATVEFTTDYWNGLRAPDEYESEPLRRFIKELSKKGSSEVSSIYQITASPIDKKDINRRYSIPFLIAKPLIYLITLFIFFVAIIINTMRDSSPNKFDIYLDKITTSFKGLFKTLTGYTRSDLTDNYDNKKSMLTSDSDIFNWIYDLERRFVYGKPYKVHTKSKDDDSISAELEGAKERVTAKSNSRNFVVQMRFLVLGDDEDKVTNKMSSIKNTFEHIYNADEYDDSVQQGVSVNTITCEEELKQLIIDISQRKTGVDKHGRIRNPYKMKSMHTNRIKPMIMSKDELIPFMHVPSEEVSDSAITRTDARTTDTITDDLVFDLDDE